jgi:ubiquinol oxidase
MRTHYAQADNELHHLLIMEALGGNESPVDRFVAQSAAFMYYWYVIMIYSFNEPAAYHLSELIEDHAYDTYNRFLTENADSLKGQPVPDIARQYYEFDNPFMFDLFCTVQDQQQEEQQQEPPTPAQQSQALSMIQQRRSRKLESLYDVFRNVRDDEKEHWKTLCNLVQYNDMNAVSASEVQSTQPAPPVVS